MKKIGCFIATGFNMLTLARLSAAVDLANSLHPKSKCYQLVLLSSKGGEVYSACKLPVISHKATQVSLHVLNSLFIMENNPALSTPGRNKTVSERALCESHKVTFVGKQSVALSTLLSLSESNSAPQKMESHFQLSTFMHALPKVNFNKESALILNRQIWTANGVWAGIDLTLTLIEEELGTAAAMQLIASIENLFNKYENNSQLAVLQNFCRHGNSDRINASLRFIRENLRNKVTITHLAELTNLSPRQFSRLFKEETGTSPATAVAQIRAEVARQHVVQNRLSIDRIATFCGFSGPKSMRRAFLKFYGASPCYFRQK